LLDKEESIMGFRNKAYRSTITGTMAAQLPRPWLDIKDDSLEGFMALKFGEADNTYTPTEPLARGSATAASCQAGRPPSVADRDIGHGDDSLGRLARQLARQGVAVVGAAVVPLESPDRTAHAGARSLRRATRF